MPESESGFIPQEATKSPKLSEHGEIIDPNQKPDSRFVSKIKGWAALARHGIRVWREQGIRPPEAGQVTMNLESLRDKMDKAKPFELPPLPPKDHTPTTDK